MEAEALDARAARARDCLGLFDIDAIAEAQDALAGPRAASDAALHACRVELGEQRLVRFQGVRIRRGVSAEETSFHQELLHAPRDGGGDACDLFVGRREVYAKLADQALVEAIRRPRAVPGRRSRDPR